MSSSVEIFREQHGLSPFGLTSAEMSAAEDLIASKFATDD
jgi:hypothetical protein